jgi:hypothetical protein
MPNQKTIIANNLPLNPDQRGLLAKLFASPEFSLLQQLLVAKAIGNQVDAMNTALYEDNELAFIKADSLRKKAVFYQAMLDELEALALKEDQWSLVALEHRR